MLGNIDVSFATADAEQEFMVLAASHETAEGDALLHAVLSQPNAHYLKKSLRWVLSVAGLEQYELIPGSGALLDQLIANLAEADDRTYVVVGQAHAGASGLPKLIADNITTIAGQQLAMAISESDSEPDANALEAEEQLLNLTHTNGRGTQARVINYLVASYLPLHTLVAQQLANGGKLARVQTKRSRLSTNRAVLKVLFSFSNNGQWEQYAVRVDAHGRYPFMVTDVHPATLA